MSQSQRRENETENIYRERMNALSGQEAMQIEPDEHLVRPIEHEPTPRVALHQEEIVSLLRATCNIKNSLPPNVALHETEEVKKSSK